ncbi:MULTISPECIES: hypothetical protein [Leptospira]|uniref:Uncharacterized protein n=7 Tax=Leptospira borgpetersenii TaxID=174 RepID=M3GVH0_LEPBO|nr:MULTISPECIES: hypothetical protein [Leptospira]EMF98843.1 hypothetical protein LEP1GSC123_3202 [Leptospira borgpetersenii str. 200701203]EMO11327.1 hypothetical protein LEP1GSC137_1362 [Leptospira borgpetersenii str. Noumea 25]EMO65052.1 hypothetical protein LEP1GSC133_3709 [Leptospira borgpetersenii serovar Pomona str. 200901868]ABJ79055.1 Hypothetical protein LBL_1596 [Leptospira borgpetersenii serovar Hardjo-bovis str. L550]ALO25583.1 hypothetical protein LBBP_01283 [Leptospira borgpeter
MESVVKPIAYRYKITEDPFEEFSDQIIKDIRNSLSNEIVITHFHFQDLYSYFKLLGEQRSGEIMKELKSIIQAYLRPYDKLYVLNPRSVLTLSPDCKTEVVEARFDEVVFQVNHLIVDYEIQFMELNSPIDSIEPIWKHLLVSSKST